MPETCSCHWALGISCSVITVLAVCVLKLLVPVGTLYSLIDVLAACPKTVSVPWLLRYLAVFQNCQCQLLHCPCMTCCVFDLFTAPPSGVSTARESGKKQFDMPILETQLHVFLGNTKCLITHVCEKLNNKRCFRHCHYTGIQCWSGCLVLCWLTPWVLICTAQLLWCASHRT